MVLQGRLRRPNAPRRVSGKKLSNVSIDMPDDPFGRVIANIHDAGLDPRMWTNVLQSISEALGAIGAEYIVRNARTGRVDWANFLGPSAKFTSDYVTRLAAKDPFTELLARRDADMDAALRTIAGAGTGAERMVQ